MVSFLLLYVDDILLIRTDVAALSMIKVWLASTFDIKDQGEASYILGIKLIRYRKWKIVGLSQASYIDKVLCNTCNFCMYYKYDISYYDVA